MNAFLQIPEQRRLLAFQQVDAAMGLQAVSVEKDFWVCWTLPGLSPPADHVANWRADYREMLGPMFFGETPTFEQMMIAATKFEKTFNATA